MLAENAPIAEVVRELVDAGTRETRIWVTRLIEVGARPSFPTVVQLQEGEPPSSESSRDRPLSSIL